MKTQLIKLSKTAGWIAFGLGSIHTVFTLQIVNDVASLEKDWQSAMIFMFVGTGLGCLLAGGNMLLSSARQIRKLKASHHVFLISSIFMLLLGIGAPIAMSDNPFGYLTLASGLFAVCLALLRYADYKKNESIN
jgi:hypothetical protein